MELIGWPGLFTFSSNEIKPDRLSERFYGSLSLPGFTVRNAESIVRSRVPGMLFDDLLVSLNGLFVLPFFCVRRGQASMGGTLTWIEPNRFPIFLYRLIELSLARELLS